MKKVFSGFVAILLLLSFTLPALAAVESPPLLQITSNPDYASVSWTLTTETDDFAILGAGGSLYKVSSTSVHASAYTQTNLTAESLGGTMYLQKWVNGAWSNVASYPFNAGYTNYSSGSVTWTVQSGYYYRLRINHYANLDADHLTRTTYTSSIFVN